MSTIDTTQGSTWDEYRSCIAYNATYTDDEKRLLMWLIDYGLRTIPSLSLKKLGSLAGYSNTVLQRLFKGGYQADTAPIFDKLARLKEITDERTNSGRLPDFIHTAVSKRVWQAADYALTRQQIVNLIGRTQRGKTTAIMQYAKQKGASVVFVRCPVGPSPTRILNRLLVALGGSTALNDSEKKLTYIMQRISSQHLIVVDEVHQIIMASRTTGIRTIEMLREIVDEAKCGLLLIGTRVWSDALTRDVAWKGILEQVEKRGITVEVPDSLLEDDIRTFWQAYGLPEPEGDYKTLVCRLAQENGLGRYTKILAIGQTLAIKDHASYAWPHFKRAVDTLAALASGN